MHAEVMLEAIPAVLPLKRRKAQKLSGFRTVGVYEVGIKDSGQLEFKKLYIAYKLDTNFVDIVVQRQRLRISLNMKFSEIYDPNNMCKDVTGLGRWGNGDVETYFEHTSDIDKVMELVEQSYRLQADED